MIEWYKLFSLTEFLATGLVSRTLSLTLQGIGEADILITKGNTNAIYYKDNFLPINFLGHNPFSRAGHSVYLDPNNFVWLGIESVV